MTLPSHQTGRPNKVAVTVMLPPDLLARLRALADAEGVSLSVIVRRMLSKV